MQHEAQTRAERVRVGVARQLLERGKHGGDEFLVVLLDNVLAERRHQLEIVQLVRHLVGRGRLEVGCDEGGRGGSGGGRGCVAPRARASDAAA